MRTASAGLSAKRISRYLKEQQDVHDRLRYYVGEQGLDIVGVLEYAGLELSRLPILVIVQGEALQG